MKKTLATMLFVCLTALLLPAQTLVQVGESVRILPKEMKSKAFSGYFNSTEIGLLIGSPSNGQSAPFSFMTTNGWHLTDQFSAGLGLGVEFASGSYLPVVLDFRYYVRDTDFSPFLFMYGGYAFPLDDNLSYYGNVIWDEASSVPYDYYYEPFEAQGGFLLNPGFGIRKLFSDSFGVNFTVGYRFQRLYYTSASDRQLFVDLSRLTLKIGITFR